ncbi:MAG: hypothetical protein PVJ69_15480 [Desulfobacteraceae bacterium]
MAFKNRWIQFCFSLLVLLVFVCAASAFGLEQSGSEGFLSGKYHFPLQTPGLNSSNSQPQPWLPGDAEVSTDDTYQPILLAQEKAQTGEEAKQGDEKPLSPECAAFAKDPSADVGDVIRAGCQPTLAQMSALMDNPLGNVAMLFTQFDFSILENPLFGKEANKVNYMGIAQFPKGISENWNIINRVVWNVPSMPVDQDKIDLAADRLARRVGSGEGQTVFPPTTAPIPPVDLFDGRTTGFGDMYYNGLFSPKKGYKTESGASLLWGLGFDLGFPTATDDVLGTGKWLAGPSGLGVYMGPKWKIGALVQQYWDYAGDDDRDDVSLMNLQYFIFYSLDDVTSIGAAPNIIANWELDSDNRWTVPIGLGISRTVQFGKVPVRFGFEVHYSVVQPDTSVGAKWNFRFYVIPAAPSALFKWMQ